MKTKFKASAVLVLAAVLFLTTGPMVNISQAADCPPTREDYEGPFYKPEAPFRTKVGEGYLFQGRVLSAQGCRPLAQAVVELWLAGPGGRYHDDYRARLRTDQEGLFRFESHLPPGYQGRPPHIHLKVRAQGHRTLTTQHYPSSGADRGEMDLILTPD